jgi:hypothetical protein
MFHHQNHDYTKANYCDNLSIIDYQFSKLFSPPHDCRNGVPAYGTIIRMPLVMGVFELARNLQH